MEALLRDARIAIRGWLRRPALLAVAVATLALGVGANTAVFSIVNGLLLRPLPYPALDRLVVIVSSGLRPDNLDAWADGLRSAELFVAHSLDRAVLERPDGAEEIRLMPVSAGFFEALGGRAVAGRLLAEDDHAPSSAPGVVLSAALATRLFGEPGAAPGTSLTFDGRAWTVVGVAPPGFRYRHYSDMDAWVPLAHFPVRGVGAFARLAEGATMAQARAEVEALTERFPAPAGVVGASAPRVERISDVIVEQLRPLLLLLLGAAGFVLLIATANVAGLQVGRGLTRRHETAVRTALGARRADLVRERLIESALLALAGGAMGILLAWWSTDLLLALAPGLGDRAGDVRLDGSVIVFAAMLVGIAALTSGAAPALHAGRAATGGIVRGRYGVERHRRVRSRDILVAGEIALAVALLCGTLLFVRALLILRPEDPGFATRDRITARVRLPETDPASAHTGFAERTLAELRRIPGVQASLITDLPLTGESIVFRATPAGVADARPANVHFRAATPGHLELMEMRLLAGRTLTDADRQGTTPSAVINTSAARRLFGSEPPVGRTFALDMGEDAVELTVVGVLGDARIHGGIADARAEVYTSLWQFPQDRLLLVVHDLMGSVDAAALRRAVAAVDPAVPVGEVRTMHAIATASVALPRSQAVLMSLFAVLAMVLAVVGCYGMLAQAVAERTREIGVRVALGADARRVTSLVVGSAVRHATVGACAGVALTLALSRVLESRLFDVVGARDPAAYLVAVAAIGGATLLAAWIPARRATRIAPVEVLAAPE